nr:ribonuclease H-like domain-containing protein [Tanacetum cinerariifolium]
REKLSKANIEIIGYQYGLESIEGQLCVHQQNEVIYEKKIVVLEYEVKDKSNLLKYTQKQLDEALREKEELKAKLENFETSSKNLTKLLDSQISVKVKTGLGYDSQFHEKEVLDIREEEVTETVFDNILSDKENSLANDRFKKGEGYHVVPPPLTRNYMPPKPDLSLDGLYDFIYKFKLSETVTSLAKDDKDAPETSTASVEKSKEDSMSHLLKDCTFHEDRMAKKSVLPTNVGKGTGHRKRRPVWNNVQRINHQNKCALTAVFTRSGRIPVSATKPKVAASTSAAKPVNTVGPKQSVNFSKSRSTFYKSHSPIRRSFYNATKCSRKNSTERVNSIGSEADGVVNGNRGHPQQALKNKGINDSDCSRHMTGNKAYLTNYKEINDGGFVAFGLSRGKIIGKGSRGNIALPELHSKMELQKARKNRTLIEAARTMLADSLLPITFWPETVNTACYVFNKDLVIKTHNKTLYELLNGKTPRLDFLRPFGYLVTILNTLDPLGKFEGKADEGFLVGYSITSKAFRVFNTKTIKVKKNLHVKFLENKSNVTRT